MTELPSKWVETQLGDICRVQGGYAFKSGDYRESGTPLLRISNIDGNKVTFDHDTVYLDEEYLQSFSDFTIQKGDILVALSGATTGKYGRYDLNETSLLNQRVARISPHSSDNLNQKYIFHYFEIIREEILKQAYGAAQPNISTNGLSSFTIPLPPLPEQHRIVDKIEELFTQLDAGVELLQKTKVLLNQYRQSVLKAAFEGKLTEEWRIINKDWENKDQISAKITDENRKVRQDVLSRRGSRETKYDPSKMCEWEDFLGIPPGWFLSILDSVCIKVIDGNYGESYPKEDEFHDEGVPFLTAAAIGENGVILHDKLKYISKEKHSQLTKAQSTIGDVIFTNRGARAGATAILLDAIFSECNIGPQLTRLQINGELISSRYLYYWMSSPKFQTIMKHQNSGSAMNFMNLTITKQLPVPVPSLQEQKILTDTIESQFSIVDEIEKVISMDGSRAKSLKKAILSKAFQGKLVPQDPADEPASKLLERIKAEGSAETPRGRKPRQTKMF